MKKNLVAIPLFDLLLFLCNRSDEAEGLRDLEGGIRVVSERREETIVIDLLDCEISANEAKSGESGLQFSNKGRYFNVQQTIAKEKRSHQVAKQPACFQMTHERYLNEQKLFYEIRSEKLTQNGDPSNFSSVSP